MRTPGRVYARHPFQAGCECDCCMPVVPSNSEYLCRADASLTKDGRLLAVSNMLTGFELYLMEAPAEVEPLFSFKQDVSAGRPLPVRYLHGDCAIVGGTSHGQVNVWDVFTRLKQSLCVSGVYISSL